MSVAVEKYLAQLNTTEEIATNFHRFGVKYAWLAMSTVILAMLATLLSSTTINVAIPEIMGAFGVGQDKTQWLATANLAAATVGMLMTSWMVNAWGIRNSVMGIMMLFTASSIVGAISPNLEVLIGARVLQGLTSGQIAPLSMSVIFLLFPHNKSGLVMGISSVGAVIAPAVGPAIGGFVNDALSWRYIFYISLPLSIICMVMTWILLPGKNKEAERVAFDWFGFITLSGALTTMLVGLSNGERDGWASNIIIAYFVSSALLWVFFIRSQIIKNNPLLNVKLFASRRFLMFSFTAFVFGAGLFGSTYVIPLFLQLVQGSSPTDSGLAMMPAGFAMALAVPFGGRLADKFDARILIALGVLFFAVSFFLMRVADNDTNFWTLAWWILIGRLGIALAIPALSLGALKSVTPEMIGQASGVMNFVRQLGGAFGVNLLSVAITRRTQFHADSLFATQSSDNSTSQQWLADAMQLLSGEGLTLLETKAVAMQYLAQSILHQAVTLSFKDAFIISAVAFLLTLIPTVMIGRSDKVA